MRSGKLESGGFAYVLLLVAIALIGLAASASVSVGASMARRDAERQLLTVGLEIQNALRSYAGVPADTITVSAARGPRALQDLLRDPRVPGLRRHLRQVYEDPITGKAEWGLVTDASGYIIGVHSQSDGKPIHVEGFPLQLAGFERATSYQQWVFGLPHAQLARNTVAATANVDTLTKGLFNPGN